jgi:hypothetical protein
MKAWSSTTKRSRLEPGFARAYHNLGYAYQHLGQLEEALEANYDKALELVVDPTERIETRHSRSICLIGAGKLEEGFREYEIRNNPRFRAYFHHMIEAPRWKGEDRRQEKLLLVGEQGLGDEFMFANILPDVSRGGRNGKLQICVDPRLVPLFQRSFPNAEVGTYDDRTLIDNDGNKALRLVPFAAKATSPICGRRWARPAILPQILAISAPGLSWCPIRRAWRIPRAGALPGKKVGICWRSMMLGAKRAKYFSPIDHAWGPVLQDAGRQLRQSSVWRQRRGNRPRRREIRRHHPQMEGLDLRDDIDGTAALCGGAGSGAVGPHRGGGIPPPASAPKSGSSPPAAPGRSWGPTNIPGMPTPACSGRKNSATGMR